MDTEDAVVDNSKKNTYTLHDSDTQEALDSRESTASVEFENSTCRHACGKNNRQNEKLSIAGRGDSAKSFLLNKIITLVTIMCNLQQRFCQNFKLMAGSTQDFCKDQSVRKLLDEYLLVKKKNKK